MNRRAIELGGVCLAPTSGPCLGRPRETARTQPGSCPRGRAPGAHPRGIQGADEFGVVAADCQPSWQRLAGSHDINRLLESRDDLRTGRRQFPRARRAGPAGRFALPPVFLSTSLPIDSPLWVHVSFCACRWRGEIVNGRIPDSLVRCGGFGALENGTCQEGAGPWMG